MKALEHFWFLIDSESGQECPDYRVVEQPDADSRGFPTPTSAMDLWIIR